MEDALQKMSAVTSTFYRAAQQTGCHSFIEFCGLMNEYIKVCETTMHNGGDFLDANTHSDKPLMMHDYHARYLAEKFDCIFGPTLRANPSAKAAFREALDL